MSETRKRRRSHPVGCGVCQRITYQRSGVCKHCETGAPDARRPDPAKMPEDLLMLCAEELLRRHNQRHAMLVKLGIKSEAA